MRIASVGAHEIRRKVNAEHCLQATLLTSDTWM
jgi:hypothetical protein